MESLFRPPSWRECLEAIGFDGPSIAKGKGKAECSPPPDADSFKLKAMSVYPPKCRTRSEEPALTRVLWPGPEYELRRVKPRALAYRAHVELSPSTHDACVLRIHCDRFFVPLGEAERGDWLFSSQVKHSHDRPQRPCRSFHVDAARCIDSARLMQGCGMRVAMPLHFLRVHSLGIFCTRAACGLHACCVLQSMLHCAAWLTRQDADRIEP